MKKKKKQFVLIPWRYTKILLFGILVSIIFLILYSQAPSFLRPLIVKYGTETDGVIIKKQIERAKGRKTVSILFIEYKAGDKVFANEYSVNCPDYSRAKDNEIVKVKYFQFWPSFIAVGNYMYIFAMPLVLVSFVLAPFVVLNKWSLNLRKKLIQDLKINKYVVNWIYLILVMALIFIFARIFAKIILIIYRYSTF